jgi:hypothetical protein
MRCERELLVIRDGEHDETAATVADSGINLVEVADDELVLLGALWV